MSGPVWGAASADLNATLLEWAAGEGPAEHVNEERDALYVVLEGSVMLTEDGGSIATIAFTSSSVGWAVLYGFGPRPGLFRTTDGGLHWKAAGPRLPRQSAGRGA